VWQLLILNIFRSEIVPVVTHIQEQLLTNLIKFQTIHVNEWCVSATNGNPERDIIKKEYKINTYNLRVVLFLINNGRYKKHEYY